MGRKGAPDVDATGWAVVGVGLTAVASLASALLTRRSAKDTTGVTGLVALNTGLETRVSRLETSEQRRAELARAHRPWDEQIYDQAKAAGWQVTPPPPLD
jgi:hypothetical protein